MTREDRKLYRKSTYMGTTGLDYFYRARNFAGKLVDVWVACTGEITCGSLVARELSNGHFSIQRVDLYWDQYREPVHTTNNVMDAIEYMLHWY